MVITLYLSRNIYFGNYVSPECISRLVIGRPAGEIPKMTSEYEFRRDRKHSGTGANFVSEYRLMEKKKGEG